MALKDDDRDMLAGIDFQKDLIASFLKHFPHRRGRVKVDVLFEGSWVGFHFDADAARSAALLNPADTNDC